MGERQKFFFPYFTPHTPTFKAGPGENEAPLELHPVSHIGGRGPSIGASFAAFIGTLARSWAGRGKPVLKQVPKRDTCIALQAAAYLAVSQCWLQG